ncbi:hypothetical protein IFO69_12695 [Echinicola sp. CAU 1574]|uniref:Lipoprotein n=1 Tax=Echinicola arenosa TaxID=2774144 RepID=A0ABR9AMR2_9BACT|nr:hypothetical protein [Echinicola arenosa]MBD8489606.1 hypothetical protein [Echinicola arenosa]
MTKSKVYFLGLITLVFTSCGVSYSEKKSIKTKEKTIDGTKYRLFNRLKFKRVQFPFTKGLMLENKISFFGLEDDIHKVIDRSEFENKIDLNRTASFRIDCISFAVNESKSKIDLLYYLTLNNQLELVTLSLEKDKGRWTLN